MDTWSLTPLVMLGDVGLGARSPMDGQLPPDHVIDISVVGDAYGRPGGALQMVVLKPDPANPDEMIGVSIEKIQEFRFKTEDWFR